MDNATPIPPPSDDSLSKELEQGLVQDARVDRVKGVTMSEEKALSPQDRDEIIVQARDFMAVRNVSTSGLAKMVGCSPSTLSEALNGTYKGDPDRIISRIRPAINEYYRSEDAPGKGAFIRTRVAERMVTAFKYASKFRKMAVILGPSGIGKTFGAKAILAKEFPSGIYVEINDTCRSVGRLYAVLVKALRLRLYKPRNPDLAEAIIDTLRNSGRMIVFDEADGLHPSSLNAIRQLHDATGCPVVFVGRPNLAKRIDATVKIPEIGASFVRRLVGRFELDDCDDGDGSGAGPGGAGEWICTAAEMAAMLKRFKVVFSPEAIRWLCTLAHCTAVMGVESLEGGGLALSLDIAEMASVCYAGRGTISVPMLQAAMGQIRGRKWSQMILGTVNESMRSEPARKAVTA